MRTARVILTLVVALFVTSLLATEAHAQATRTWVSGVGDDANPCSRTAPCKTFGGAISKTAAGGEISALDPGGFGAVTITKAITINGDGTLAGILNSLTNGIIVNAAAADKVIIRNISINGATNGINGIRYLAGGQLVVDNVTISGCTTTGIDMSLTATSGNLHVRDTRITKCTTGINVTTTSGNAIAVLDNVRIDQMTNGVTVGANGRAAIRNSSFANHSSNAVLLSAATSIANVFGNMFAHNGTGVRANVSGASARISGNGFFNNSTGIAAAVAGAIVSSDGTNVFGGNSTDGTPTLPVLLRQ